MSQTFREPVLLVLEYNANVFDARCSRLGRLLTVTTTESGDIRVHIKGENVFAGQTEMVTVSDETMPVEAYLLYIKPTLVQLYDTTSAHAVIRQGSFDHGAL